MAYDKVVDSSVLDAGLKAIADAIREKGGTSDNLAFPTAMAEAIAAIESGGEDVTVVTGTYTFASTVYNFTLEHGLGVIPKVLILKLDTSAYSTSLTSLSRNIVAIYAHGYIVAGYTSYTGSGLRVESTTSKYAIANITETTVYFNASYMGGSFKSGDKYTYYAMG